MPNTREINYIRGPLSWAKVLGDPVDNYDKNGREWTFDLALDKDGVRQMNSIKVQGKPVKNIKEKDERGPFVSFKQKFREPEDFERYGKKVLTVAEQRIKVMDAAGNPWPQDVKLGNGTIADVKFESVDYGKGKYAGVYPRAIRILKHVPFESQEFAPLAEDDEFSKAANAGADFTASFLGHTASRDDEDLDDVL